MEKNNKKFIEKMQKNEVKITWFDTVVPKDIDTKQVYGVLFDEFGRILLRVKNNGFNKRFSLAGGKPETNDKNIEETLRREVLEEVNVTLQKDIFYVGYQLIENDDNKNPYAQVRMAAMIKNIGEKKPDVDGGEIYDRLLTHPKRVIELLDWGDIGKQMIEKAVKVAKEKFNLQTSDDAEDLWI